MKKYKVLIVDDEAPAREVIKKFITVRSDLELVGECENGFECLKFLSSEQVDLLFLDIQMPKLNGFEVVELMVEKPSIIFVTAFDQYAIKAFEVNAVDYVLKPFSKDRFFAAVDKAIQNFQTEKSPVHSHQRLAESYSDQMDQIDRIVVRQGNKIEVVQVDQIRYLQAESDYVMIVCEKGKFLKNKTMRYFEDHLPQTEFIRIHRSFIVNMTFVKNIEKYTKDTYLAILTSGEKLNVSQEGYKRIRKKIV